MHVMSRQDGSLGSTGDELPASDGRIERAVEGQVCDVCHQTTDVAQVVGVFVSPGSKADGYQTISYLCAFCAARAIQVVTGFRAEQTVASWYRARENAANLRASKPK